MIAEAAVVENGKWTYEAISNMDDDKSREIYQGSVFELPSPSIAHQLAYRALVRAIERWVDAGGRGILFYQPVDLVLANEIFVPDLSYFQTDDVASVVNETGKYMVSPPDLVVELTSPATAARDRVTKYLAYAEFGVRHYWIIDPEAQTLHAFRLNGDHYEDEAVLKSGDEFHPALFPGLIISLDNLFQS